jgi:hypothetical protein
MAHYSWSAAPALATSNTGTLDTSTVPGLVAVKAPTVASGSTTLTVGVGKEFSTLSAAVAAAHNGDTILVNAGTYTNDFSIVNASITIEGVGGMANFVATEAPTDLKGIITVDNNVTIENCSFSGAAISTADGANGAGIRYEGGNMTLENDSFSNNQNGIMGTPVIASLTQNNVVIDHCLFQNNGIGNGLTHNCYIGAASSLTFTNNISEGAIVGHELKSRALVNTISNNIFQDGATGTASYEIDLPNGGADTITNNIIEKGPNAQNQYAVHFGGEGIPYAGSSLTVSGNNFVNDFGSSEVAVLNQTPYTVSVTGNEFTNFSAGNIIQGPSIQSGNVNADGSAIASGTLTGVLPGSTVIYTDSAAHSLSLTGSIQAVEGGGGMLTATAISGHIIAIGGNGGMHFSETGSSGGNTISTMAGSTNTLALIGQDLVSSAGTDTITCGANNVSGQVTGTATIKDGTGNNQWSVTGTAAITGQGGSPIVSVGSTGTATINGTLSYLYVQNNGGGFSVGIMEDGVVYAAKDIGGGVTDQISNGTQSIVTSGGTVGADLFLTRGTTLVTSVGNDVIHAGSGNDTVILEAGGTVYAGTGSLSIYGRGDTVGGNIYGNGGTYYIAGDSGNLTYHGGALASTVQAVLSNITLLGGAGRLSVQGGSRDVMTGGAGGLNYTATDGGGADLITTAASATDTLSLASADTVNSHGTDLINAGIGNQIINLYGNSTVTGGTGNNQILVSGHDVVSDAGQDAITVTDGASLALSAGTLDGVVETGASMVNFSVSGANAGQVAVSGGSATITGGQNAGGGIDVYTNAGATTHVNMLQGTDTVYSLGSDVIQGGAGNGLIYITANADKITGGSGALRIVAQDNSTTYTQTVTGGSGSLSYAQYNGHLNFIGGSGSATIDGGTGTLHVVGGSGTINVSEGLGGMQFIAGTGTANVVLTPLGGTVEFGAGITNAQVAGWGAGDLFECTAGHGGGTDTITGFRAGTDTLQFNGVSVTGETISGGNTTLNLSDHSTIHLLGFADTGHIF